MRAVGHKLKGSGGTFGFDDLSVLGERLEKTAERTDALGTLDELGWYLEHVHVVYRRPSEEAPSSMVEGGGLANSLDHRSSGNRSTLA